MALRHQGLQISQIGAGNLNLTPADDEGIRITNIQSTLAITAQLVCLIDRRQVRTIDWYHVTVPTLADCTAELDQHPLSMRLISQLPGMFPIPLGRGQIFNITGVGAAESVIVTYDVYDGGDVSPEEPNGSEAKEHSFVQVITNPAAAAWGNVIPMNVQVTPAAFTAFPANPAVPRGMTITIHGLAGIPFMEANAGAIIGRTQRIRGVLNREQIFGAIGQGLDFLGAGAGAANVHQALVSLVGRNTNAVTAATNHMSGLYKFTPPLVFGEGDSFAIEVDSLTGGAGGAVAAANVVLFVPMTVKQA